MKLRSGFVANSSSSSFVIMVNGAINSNGKSTFNPEDLIIDIGGDINHDDSVASTSTKTNLMHYIIDDVEDSFGTVTKNNYIDYYYHLLKYYEPIQLNRDDLISEAIETFQYDDDLMRSNGRLQSLAEELANYNIKLSTITNEMYNFNTTTAMRIHDGAKKSHILSYETMWQLLQDYKSTITNNCRYIKMKSSNKTIYETLKDTVVCDEYVGDFETYSNVAMKNESLSHMVELAVYRIIDDINEPYIRSFGKLLQMAIIFHRNPSTVLLNISVGDDGYDGYLHEALINGIWQSNSKVKVLWHERE
jgi:hypothetical protein|nr:MAG TPA: hypothetical protein [Caudoviricetes sp.]